MTPRYVLEQRIGTGGMAEVFRARREDRVYAIKRLRPEQANDPALRDRLLDEFRIASRLLHPCIVAVLDSYEQDGALHLVLEYVDGISVEHLIARALSGALVPLPVTAAITREVARALEYAHARGVLHRDVSASNVLVSATGEVKLTDFGLADAAGRVSATEPGQVVGKWTYLSPRRQRGEPATVQDDLYALGVLVDRLLASADPRDRARNSGNLKSLQRRLVDENCTLPASEVVAALSESADATAVARFLGQPLPGRRRSPPTIVDLHAETQPRRK